MASGGPESGHDRCTQRYLIFDPTAPVSPDISTQHQCKIFSIMTTTSQQLEAQHEIEASNWSSIVQSQETFVLPRTWFHSQSRTHLEVCLMAWSINTLGSWILFKPFLQTFLYYLFILVNLVLCENGASAYAIWCYYTAGWLIPSTIHNILVWKSFRPPSGKVGKSWSLDS